MKRKLAYLLSVAFMFISCIKEKPTGADLMVGDIIPDFEVTMNDGSVITGEGLRETPSCIVFFHTSCPDCQKALPVIQEIYDKYAQEGFSFALISREEEEDTIAAYWKEKAYTMPYSAQPTREVYNLFAQTKVPRIYICEKGGIIRAIYTDDPVPGLEELDQSINSVYGNGME